MIEFYNFLKIAQYRSYRIENKVLTVFYLVELDYIDRIFAQPL